jgi:hypothetical protein
MSSSSSLKSAKVALLQAAVLALAMACGFPASAGEWRLLLPQAQVLGKGDMSWFGLRIYHATLWSAHRPFDATLPFALQLRYHRSISRHRLVSTSMDEIARLGPASLSSATRTRWEAMLASALVDVREGDELTGVYLPGLGMRLYDRQKLLAELRDEELARAFFGIWLHADSRDAVLRQQLLGAQP